MRLKMRCVSKFKRKRVDMKNFVEECWFIYGIKFFGKFVGFRVYHSSGTPGSVEFKWEKALSKFLIGWVHTHPSGITHVSDTDDRTMRGWCIGLGKPLLCVVVADGQARAWCYWKKRKSRHNIVVLRKETSILFVGPFVFADTCSDKVETPG